MKTKVLKEKETTPLTYVILAILLCLSLVEFIPLIMAMLFNFNYGASKVGIIQQYLNEKIYLAYIGWFSFNIIMVLLLIQIYKSALHAVFKSILMSVILIFVYICIYPLLHIMNTIFACVFRNPPFIKDYYIKFPYAKVLEDNCIYIQKEFQKNYTVQQCIDRSIPGFQISTGSSNKCWRTVVLKKQGTLLQSALNQYPVTSALLKHASIHNAIFSILDGNVSIPPHTGYYKGYLRYHLGIEIPSENGKSAFLTCGGQRYTWTNCKGVLFDDMYIHSVVNPTSKRRVVLYIDVIRNDVPKILLPLYNLTNWYIETHPTIKHIVDLQHAQRKQ